jgi:hypothetical protein
MYHCLDDQRLQTVPAERHFVQIDNSIASHSSAHKLPRKKKQTRSLEKSFAAFLIPHHCSTLPQLS